MEPALAILAAWILFGGSHLALASNPLRAAIVRRVGERRFPDVFSLVAAPAFVVLSATAAVWHAEGAAGPALGTHSLIRPLTIAAIFIGFALAAGSLSAYPRSPMAIGSNRVGEVRGVERISRHAFFMGLALWAGAHVLLAPTLAGAVFFSGFVIVTAAGSALQDRKLAKKLGAPYDAYLAQTSTLPFAAILAGRQRLALGEQPWLAFAVGAALAWGLREVHAHIFDYYGAYIVGVTLGGAGFATWGAKRRERQLREQKAAA